MVFLTQLAEVPFRLFRNCGDLFGIIQFERGKIYKFEVYVMAIGKFKKNKSEKCAL